MPLEARRADDLAGAAPSPIDRVDGPVRVEVPRRLGAPEPLGQARLGVVVHQQDAPAHRASVPARWWQVDDLADAPLLVQQGDRGGGHGGAPGPGLTHGASAPAR